MVKSIRKSVPATSSVVMSEKGETALASVLFKRCDLRDCGYPLRHNSSFQYFFSVSHACTVDFEGCHGHKHKFVFFFVSGESYIRLPLVHLIPRDIPQTLLSYLLHSPVPLVILAFQITNQVVRLTWSPNSFQ